MANGILMRNLLSLMQKRFLSTPTSSAAATLSLDSPLSSTPSSSSSSAATLSPDSPLSSSTPSSAATLSPDSPLSSSTPSSSADTLSPDSPLSSSPPPPPSFTVQCLVNSCGLSLDSALKVSQNFHLHENNLQNFQSVFDCFKSHYMSSLHITRLIKRRPQILNYQVENNLKPKLQLLERYGIVGLRLQKVFLSNPVILNADLDSQVKPCFQFLKSVLGSNRNIAEAIKHSSQLLTCDLKGSLQANIDFLIKEGVPFDRVAEFLIRNAITLLHKHNSMVNAVHDLKNLGLDPKDPVFLDAVRVRIHMSESIWQDKIEVMKSLGWSEEEIFSAFKRDPNFLKSPAEKIRVVTDFFVNTLNLGRQILSENPEFFSFKMDKRCRPRYDVLKLLESEKLIEGDVKIEEVLKMRYKEFLVNYVNKDVDKVPGLWKTFKGMKQQQSLPRCNRVLQSRGRAA